MPILAEYKNQQGEEATRTFIAYVSGLLTLVLALVTALGILAAPWVIWVTAPGFADTPEKFALTTDLLRVTFPYILLISLSSLAGAILNTWNRFSVPAFVPTLLNVAMIGFALFLTPYFDPPVMVLGWAVLAGGLLQLLYQLPHLRKIGMLVLPRLNLRDSGVWRVMKLMLPAILGVSVSQISLIINTIFASFLAAGSVSWMYYADRLMELPSGVLGVALGTILLPMLAKTYSNKDRHEYSRLLDWGLRLCFLLVLPCSLALAILAEPLTVSLFQYGKFTTVDAAMTQRALVAYSVGLLGIILVKVLAPGFYAQQNIRTPVKIALFTLVSTQLMNLAFIGPLQHAGLALSIGLAACLNAGLLYWQLRKQRRRTCRNRAGRSSWSSWWSRCWRCRRCCWPRCTGCRPGSRAPCWSDSCASACWWLPVSWPISVCSRCWVSACATFPAGRCCEARPGWRRDHAVLPVVRRPVRV